MSVVTPRIHCVRDERGMPSLEFFGDPIGRVVICLEEIEPNEPGWAAFVRSDVEITATGYIPEQLRLVLVRIFEQWEANDRADACRESFKARCLKFANGWPPAIDGPRIRFVERPNSRIWWWVPSHKPTPGSIALDLAELDGSIGQIALAIKRDILGSDLF